MADRTILIHLNDRRRAARLVTAAKAIVGLGGAHLIGLHVASNLPLLAPVAVPYGDDVINAVRQSEQRESEAIAATFRDLTGNAQNRATWLSLTANGPDLAGAVMQHGRAADLIVAAQADPEWDMAPVLDFPERLAIESGRPLLMVPNAGTFTEPPRHALIAWNGSRESARAAFDALPLIEPGCRVTVLVVEDVRGSDVSSASAEALAAKFNRHGLAATVHRASSGSNSIGEVLLAEARARGADLLVMGAYGHSRFRELVFGGATRHVTHHLEILTLLSH